MIERPDPECVNEVSQLSPREREVAALLGQGLTIPTIAARLCRTLRTCQTHVERIHRKLRTGNTAMIAAWATRTGLVDHPEWYDKGGHYVGGQQR